MAETKSDVKEEKAIKEEFAINYKYELFKMFMYTLLYFVNMC